MNDVLSAIGGGAVGTAVIVVVLFVTGTILGEGPRTFELVAEMIGTPGAVFLGFVLFVGAGVFLWPLLFMSLGRFLPGASESTSGMVFAAILWVGFVMAFSRGLAGTDLLLYAVLSLLAHLAYGFTLGAVYDRLGEHRLDIV